MKISLRAVAPHFQRSINLTYDSDNTEYITGYIPTPSGVRALAEIIANTSPRKKQRAHLLHAAYGSGKSLLGVVLSTLVDNASKKQEALEVVLARLSRLFPAEAQTICARKSRLLPVLLSANTDKLELDLLQALTRTLAEYELTDLRPKTRFKAALDTIILWEKTYPDTFSRLKGALLDRDTNILELRKELEEFRPTALALFESLYPDLTAGAQFNGATGQSLVDVFGDIAKGLHQHGFDGLIVIWDEFGRFVEAKTGEAFGEEAQLLQQLAEFCNRSGKAQMHLVLITHRLLSGYAAQLPLNYQQEWARIAGRFRSHDISSDPLVTYKLINEALIAPNPIKWQEFTEQHQTDFSDLTARAVELVLFEDLENVAHVIQQAWPLHPLSLYALPRLSSQVAQNERTLFTFLAADEPGTLTHLFNQDQSGWWLVGLDSIWDYFAEAICIDIGVSGTHPIWSGVMYALSKTGGNLLAARVMKALGVLLITGEVNVRSQTNIGRVIPSTELIAWSLSETEDNVAAILETLARRRAVIFRQTTGYWTFTRGSDIDLEAEIAAIADHVILTPLQKRQTLEQATSLPFHLPRNYNSHYQMIRFFWSIYRPPTDLASITDDFIKQLGSVGYADGVVVYVAASNAVELQETLNLLPNLSKRRAIYVVPDAPLLINTPLSQLFALWQLSNDAAFLQQDERLAREVEFFIEETKQQLQSALCPLQDPNMGSAQWWWHDGEMWRHERVKSGVDISQLLSRACECWFNRTPKLNNEGLNKQEPTKQQISAAEKVIDALFQYQGEILAPNLGLSGYGPEILVLKTLLIQTGLLQSTNNIWCIDQPINNPALVEIWGTVQGFLNNANTGGRDIVELIEKLQLPPFGLRRGVLPVLLAAMMHHRLHVLTIRQGRKVISPLTGEVFTQLCSKPEQFTIEVGQWDETRAMLWHVLERQFHGFTETYETDRQPLASLSQRLLYWLQAQPRFCRDTDIHISLDAQKFRNLVRKAQREPAAVLLYDLLELLRGRTDLVDETSLEHRLQELMDEIATALSRLLYYLEEFIQEHFAQNVLAPRGNAQVILRYWLANLEQRLDEGLDALRFNDVLAQRLVQTIRQEHEGSRFWDALAKAVIDVSPHDWDDVAIKRFEDRLLEARDRLEREAIELAEDEEVIELSIALPHEQERRYRFRPTELSDQGQRIIEEFLNTLNTSGRQLSSDERRKVSLMLLHHTLEEQNGRARRIERG